MSRNEENTTEVSIIVRRAISSGYVLIGYKVLGGKTIMDSITLLPILEG